MKKYLAILMFVFSLTHCSGQDEVNFDWVQIALGNSFSMTTSVDTDDNSAIYHCGSIANFGQTDFSVEDSIEAGGSGYIAKVSSNGDFLWGKTFINNLSLYDHPYFKRIKVLNSGDIICAFEFVGTIDFDPSPNIFEMTSSGGANTGLIKLSSNGDFIWAKKIEGEPSFTSSCFVNGLDTDQSDNIYLSGLYTGQFDFDPGPDTTSFNPINFAGYLLKLDNNGEFQWVNTVDGPYGDGLFDVEVNNDNHVITAGYFYDSIHIQSIHLDSVMTSISSQSVQEMIIKYDENGEALWITRLEATNFKVNDINIDSNNDIYLAGSFTDTLSFISGTNDNLTSNGSNDAFVAKYTSTGEYVWGRQIGGTLYDNVASVQLNENGNVLVATNLGPGTLYFESFPLHTNFVGGSKIFILNSSSGNYIDEISLNGSIEIRDTQLDGKGGFISVGSCNTGPYWSIDFNPDPDEEYFSLEEGPAAFIHKLTLIDYPKTTEEITLYPNPSNGITTILIPDLESPMNVQVFDFTGRLVKEFQILEKLSSVELHELSVGVCLLRFTTNENTILKKFVKI